MDRASEHVPEPPGRPARPPEADPNQPRLLLTVSEAARMLAIGRSTTYELLTAGHLRSVRIGRARRIPLRALDEFVASLGNHDTAA